MSWRQRSHMIVKVKLFANVLNERLTKMFIIFSFKFFDVFYEKFPLHHKDE